MTSRFGAFFDRYSAMPLNDLPVELVALILPHNLRPIQFRDHEERTRELLSYACSCRALRAAAETLLWQDVIVATPHQAGALLSALYRDKRGSRIRSLHVGSTRDEDAQDYELSELFSVLGDEVESLSLLSVTSLELTQLTLLPQLKFLSLAHLDFANTPRRTYVELRYPALEHLVIRECDSEIEAFDSLLGPLSLPALRTFELDYDSEELDLQLSDYAGLAQQLKRMSFTPGNTFEWYPEENAFWSRLSLEVLEIGGPYDDAVLRALTRPLTHLRLHRTFGEEIESDMATIESFLALARPQSMPIALTALKSLSIPQERAHLPHLAFFCQLMLERGVKVYPYSFEVPDLDGTHAEGSWVGRRGDVGK